MGLRGRCAGFHRYDCDGNRRVSIAAAVVRSTALLVLSASVSSAAGSAELMQAPSAYAHCVSRVSQPSQSIAACTAVINAISVCGRPLAAAYNSRGIAWSRMEELNRAIADFSRAISCDPGYARAYLNRGVALHKKSETDKALADIDRAVVLEPAFPPAYIERARTLLAKGEIDRARTLLAKGEIDRAVVDATTAIRLNPISPQAYVTRGIAHGRKAMDDQSLADLEQALRLDPRLALGYNARGILNGRQGRHAAAIADFDRALRINPRYVAALVNRAASQERTGDTARALADFAAALAIDKANAKALAGRDRLANSRSSGLGKARGNATPSRDLQPRVIVPPNQPPAVLPPTPATAAPPAPPRLTTAIGTAGLTASPAAVSPSESRPRPSPQRSATPPTLADAVSACARQAEDMSKIGNTSTRGKGPALPGCYKGRRHIDCVVTALLDEAAAIDRDYGEIVASNYPDLKDADAICRIDSRRIDEHVAKSKGFDARSTALQSTFSEVASCIEQVRQAAGQLDLSAMQDSGTLMKSVLDNVSSPIDRAAGRQRAVLRLVQGIEASQKAMATIRSIRSLACP